MSEETALKFWLHQLGCVASIVYYWVLSVLEKVTPLDWWPEKDVRGKTVLITGAGRGFGRHFAIEFAKRGANLVLWSRSEGPLVETKELVEGLGVKVLAATVDISKRAEVHEAAEEAKSKFGHVDIVINNAAVCWAHCTATLDPDELDSFIKTNFLSTHYVNHEFLPDMIERDEGHIVAICSASGIITIPFQTAYASSKFALNAYMNCLHAELQALKSNVKTTVISPYVTQTEMTKDFKTSTVPRLLPDLTTDYVIHRGVHAILTDQTEVYIGRFWYLIKIFLACVPYASAYHFMRLIGLDGLLLQMVGNKIPQKLTNNNNVE
ncbi:unnamed protein product [Bursaphelenchus xylophilus]|uniref:(pine wood nematode) hypothetical protein n=1 Tax=Bursaphelenchus xylophilus TaxID=6326 RepID=A0A1I7SS19_BURXY|nr:unnamed protein product [Bursaphelenchus xylophilus]CAG9105787.1 unnamed protein product [Bursaphelenchus xylophilus]